MDKLITSVKEALKQAEKTEAEAYETGAGAQGWTVSTLQSIVDHLEREQVKPAKKDQK